MKNGNRSRMCVVSEVLVAAAVLFGSVAAPLARADEPEPDAIMELARAGRNREAIDAFEALPPDGRPYPLALLRAVAGCYWREREFDAARALYNEILERRPTLQGSTAEGRPRPLPEDAPQIMPPPEPAPSPEAEPVVEAEPAPDVEAEAVVEAEPAPEVELEAVEVVTPVVADTTPVETPAPVAPENHADPEVEAVAEADALVADPGPPDAPSGLDQVLDALRQEYIAIDARAREREAELRARMQALQGETVAAVRETDDLKRGLAEERERRLEIEAAQNVREAELEARSEALGNELEAATAELGAARAVLDRAAVERAEADAVQAAEREALKARVAEMNEASAVLHGRMDEVQADLERERAISRELKAWREAREATLQEEVAALASAAIENALREIDQLEREYADLDAAARARQEELEARIARLTEEASQAQISATRLESDLQREYAQREALEAREAEREKALEEAQFALRTVASGVLEQLERIHNELVAHKAELRISHERERELRDVVPALNQLEAAARESAEETATLRRRIEEQAVAFETEREGYREAVAGLEQRIGTLTERNAALESELADTQAALVDAEAAAMRVRERLELFESAFSSPGGTFDPDLLSGIERIFASIAKTAQDDPALAVQQFERLPDTTVVPVSLLKTIAGIYRDTRNFASARALYERALALEPGDLQTERRLIMTLFDMGKYDEALARLGGSGRPGQAADK